MAELWGSLHVGLVFLVIHLTHPGSWPGQANPLIRSPRRASGQAQV